MIVNNNEQPVRIKLVEMVFQASSVINKHILGTIGHRYVVASGAEINDDRVWPLRQMRSWRIGSTSPTMHSRSVRLNQPATSARKRGIVFRRLMP